MNHTMHDHGTHAASHGTDGHSDHGHIGHGDKPDVHGMLVVGEETVYLSHLPMFDHPHHAYQAVLEVTFTRPGGDPHARYVNDRRAHRETTMYTLVPERFVLSDLVASGAAETHPRSFKATIFRGHFERGGTPILENVQVTVSKVVYFRGFEPLGYLLFGNGQERFLAHVITNPPDFDQVLSVKVTGHEFTQEELRQGVRVTFPGRGNTLENRLKPGERVTGEVRVASRGAAETVEPQLEVTTELYFEEGELRSPPTFMPTPAEQAAGF